MVRLFFFALALLGAAGRAAAQDTTAPGVITDLSVSWHEVEGYPGLYMPELAWTAPGDDGYSAGTQVAFYEFRGGGAGWPDLTEQNWNGHPELNSLPYEIRPSGESMTVRLYHSYSFSGSPYSFGVKAHDEDGNSPGPAIVSVILQYGSSGDSNICGGSATGLPIGLLPWLLVVAAFLRG